MSYEDVTDGWDEDIELDTSTDKPLSERIYDTVARASYPFYNHTIHQRNEFVSAVELDLIQANRSEPVEKYLSAYLGFGFIFGLVFGLVVVISQFNRYNELLLVGPFQAPNTSGEVIVATGLVAVGSILITLLILAVCTVLGGVTSTYLAANQQTTTIRKRRGEIEILLPDAVAFMYCLSTGGMNRIDIIRALAESDDSYGEVSTEFQRIVHNMDSFSEDYHNAIGDVSDTTPSPSLANFLNDMLSTITSGGQMDSFLKTQLTMFQNQVEQTQKAELDKLEMFNEVYITLSLIPVIGIIVLAFAGAMGLIDVFLLLVVVYIVIPAVQLIALGIIVTIFESSYGDGKLHPDEHDNFTFVDDSGEKILSAGLVSDYQGISPLFDRVYVNEIRSRILTFLSDPLVYVQRKPAYVFWITVPSAAMFVALAIVTGNIQFDTAYITQNAFIFTLVSIYIPTILVFAPFVYFYEVGLYRRGKITDGLTTDLNKLANVNEQGIPLRQSMLITGQDSDTLLAAEFRNMYKKQDFGIPLSKSIIETNNKYAIPRLSRLFRIIKSAQDISNNITQVLKTAASLSETQEKVIAERKSRTRQQIGVVVIIFFVFLASLVLMQGFILDGIAGGGIEESTIGPSSTADPIPAHVIGMLFYHGAVIQGTLAGFICGYIRTGEYAPGIKYSLAFLTMVMGIWYVF